MGNCCYDRSHLASVPTYQMIYKSIIKTDWMFSFKHRTKHEDGFIIYNNVNFQRYVDVFQPLDKDNTIDNYCQYAKLIRYGDDYLILNHRQEVTHLVLNHRSESGISSQLIRDPSAFELNKFGYQKIVDHCYYQNLKNIGKEPLLNN